jgi:hypothetical protein
MKKSLLLVPVAAAAALMVGCTDYLCVAPPGTTQNTKFTMCHATGAKKGDKYTLVTVSGQAAAEHYDHGDFLAPSGAKKASECKVPVIVVPPVVVPPVVVPPIVVPPIVVPPVVVPPVVVPPVVVPPVVVPPIVVPPIVVPPIVVPPVTTPSEDDGSSTDVPDEEVTPPTGGNGNASTPLTPEEILALVCLSANPPPTCGL